MFFRLELKVVVEGKTELSWSYSPTLAYTDKVEHINIDTILKEPDDSSDAIKIIAGAHNFDFEFYIPSDCPSSFESMRGRTRYVVKVVYIKPTRELKSIPFSVVNPLNLNKYSETLKVSI